MAAAAGGSSAPGRRWGSRPGPAQPGATVGHHKARTTAARGQPRIRCDAKWVKAAEDTTSTTHAPQTHTHTHTCLSLCVYGCGWVRGWVGVGVCGRDVCVCVRACVHMCAYVCVCLIHFLEKKKPASNFRPPWWRGSINLISQTKMAKSTDLCLFFLSKKPAFGDPGGGAHTKHWCGLTRPPCCRAAARTLAPLQLAFLGNTWHAARIALPQALAHCIRPSRQLLG